MASELIIIKKVTAVLLHVGVMPSKLLPKYLYLY